MIILGHVPRRESFGGSDRNSAENFGYPGPKPTIRLGWVSLAQPVLQPRSGKFPFARHTAGNGKENDGNPHQDRNLRPEM